MLAYDKAKIDDSQTRNYIRKINDIKRAEGKHPLPVNNIEWFKYTLEYVVNNFPNTWFAMAGLLSAVQFTDYEANNITKNNYNQRLDKVTLGKESQFSEFTLFAALQSDDVLMYDSNQGANISYKHYYAEDIAEEIHEVMRQYKLGRL